MSITVRFERRRRDEAELRLLAEQRIFSFIRAKLWRFALVDQSKNAGDLLRLSRAGDLLLHIVILKCIVGDIVIAGNLLIFVIAQSQK